MNYTELLSNYIEKSRLSHREISRRCKELGKSVSQAYISQLVRGDVPPASDEVNEVIAKVIDANIDELYIASYLEKMPDNIRNFFIEKKHDVNDQKLLDMFHKLDNTKQKIILDLLSNFK
jgi:hypothetical protein